MPGRYGTGDYRYGFQGQEKDEKTGLINYKYRMYRPEIGRFFAVDPLAPKYPFYSPYQFSGNKLIAWVELEGLEEGEILPENEDELYFAEKVPSSNPENQIGYKNRNYLNESLMEGLRKYSSDNKIGPMEELYYHSLISVSLTTSDKFNLSNKGFAARNFGRYIVGEGGYDILNYNYLNKYSQFNSLRNKTDERLIREIINNETVIRLKNGESTYVVVNQDNKLEQYGANEGPLASDYTLAIGSGHLMASGVITVSKSAEGVLSFSGKVSYTFYDHYGWESGRALGIPHAFSGMINHSQAEELQKLGAKDFDMRSYFTSDVSSFMGLLYIGNHQNSKRTTKHPKKDNSDSIKGKSLIYEF